jgi:hypothetical protein
MKVEGRNRGGGRGGDCLPGESHFGPASGVSRRSSVFLFDSREQHGQDLILGSVGDLSPAAS